MYQPSQFAAKNRQHALTLMRTHPFATLISIDDHGLPYITHLPLHLQEAPAGAPDEVTHPVLLGHCAKANPQWRYLIARPHAVVSFLGPHAYMSPKVYPDLRRVPTWNYLAVQCTVQAKMIEEDSVKDQLLKQLIADHEPAYAQQWQSLEADYTQKMLSAIVAFELRIIDMQCTLKLNQHRPEAHAAMRQAMALGSENEKQLGEWMDKLGVTGKT